MFHRPPGTSGLLVGSAIGFLIGESVYLTRGPGPFNLDPQEKPGAFEPFLAKYIRVTEFIIGLATGPVVFLIGSSAL